MERDIDQPANILQTTGSGTAVSFNMWRTLRLSSFQIGSATADILTASVWNRVMIAELGMPATWVGLLLALQYLLMPISFWAGHRSDTRPLWGRRRVSYIWLGRGLVVLSFPLLGM
ncbi:MAG TPA: PucC family protein, partial [Chloroflexota bacterium]|nr:PucC family protein [Chloroflexota bacterium]